MKKSVITNDDVNIFLENHFLVENLGIKCRNYEELSVYIERRARSYHDRKVSIERINEITVHFNGSTGYFQDDKSCGVCLKNYEEDQEVCHLPCTHFFCRNCTENMFVNPPDGSKRSFQCPVCRDDCTSILYCFSIALKINFNYKN